MPTGFCQTHQVLTGKILGLYIIINYVSAWCLNNKQADVLLMNFILYRFSDMDHYDFFTRDFASMELYDTNFF